MGGSPGEGEGLAGGEGGRREGAVGRAKVVVVVLFVAVIR